MDPVPLIHTAEVCLGLGQEAFGSRVPQHRQLLRESFSRLVTLCLERRAQVLLIAGDLFATPRPSRKTAQFAWHELSRLGRAQPPVQAVILPGGRDPVSPGGVYEQWLAEGLPAHLHLLADPQAPAVTLLGGAVVVHGAESLPPRAAGAGARFRLGMRYAAVRLGDLLDHPGPQLTPAEIAASGLDYLALGYPGAWGDYSTGGVTALYPGPLELLSPDQSEPGQALCLTLHPGASPGVERVPTGQLRRGRVEIALDGLAEAGQIAEQIRQSADPHLLLEATLAGRASPTLFHLPEELESQLGGEFWRLRVREEAALDEAALAPGRYPRRLVAGRFVDLVRAAAEEADAEQREPYRRALSLGLALLGGQEALG